MSKKRYRPQAPKLRNWAPKPEINFDNDIPLRGVLSKVKKKPKHKKLDWYTEL